MESLDEFIRLPISSAERITDLTTRMSDQNNIVNFDFGGGGDRKGMTSTAEILMRLCLLQAYGDAILSYCTCTLHPNPGPDRDAHVQQIKNVLLEGSLHHLKSLPAEIEEEIRESLLGRSDVDRATDD